MSLTTEQIKEHSKKVALGMSNQQIQDYVIASHVTNDRQFKQALLEIEQREHNRKKMVIGRRKSLCDVKRAEKELKEALEHGDELDVEVAQINVDDAALDVGMWERRMQQLDYEHNVFIEFVKRNADSIEELEKKAQWTDEEEKRYWVARMGKQAALDIVCHGRISVGNMDSIAMMKENDQMHILDLASQYSCLMKVSMDKIQGRTNKYFQAYAESPDINIPSFHGIEHGLNIPLLDQIKNDVDGKMLQSSDQPQE